MQLLLAVFEVSVAFLPVCTKFSLSALSLLRSRRRRNVRVREGTPGEGFEGPSDEDGVGDAVKDVR